VHEVVEQFPVVETVVIGVGAAGLVLQEAEHRGARPEAACNHTKAVNDDDGKDR
jgi:hypothetical protein